MSRIAEGIEEAPNPNPNDFILEPRSGSKKSTDGSRNQDHKTNKRWSAEAVIVSGNILVPRSGSKRFPFVNDGYNV